MLNSFLKYKLSFNKYYFIGFVVFFTISTLLYLITSNDFVFFKVNHFHTPFLDVLNAILTLYGQGEYQIFFLVFLLLIPYFRNIKYISITCLYAILIGLVNYGLKKYFYAPRPLLVYGINEIKTVQGMPNSYINSFPSGHTSASFAMFTLLLFLLPLNRYKWLQFLFLFLACGTAYSRMYLGQHFFEDVIAGSVLGVIIGIGLGVFSEKMFTKKSVE